MSKFSKHLEYYMNEHEITVADLVEETGMDRVTIYRYVKGTRNPTDVLIVETLLDALRVRIAEKKEFLEEYDRLIMGDQIVDSYKYVNKLLKELKNISQNQYTRERTWKKIVKMPIEDRTISLEGTKEIEMCAAAFFENVVKRADENTSVYFLIQPVYKSLQELMISSFRGKKIKIEQIVCLEQNIQKSYRNLEVFRQLLPVCFDDMNYDVRYYYSSLTEHINEMTWMPNLIFSDSYVLQFDYEMEYGVFIDNKEYAESVHKKYKHFKNSSEKFLFKTEGLDSTQKLYKEMLGNFKNFIGTEDMVVNTLFVQPCLGMCVSSDIYEKYLYPMPMKEMFIKGMTATRGDWDKFTHLHNGQNIPLKTENYFQLNGLKDFMDNGRIREFPTSFYTPLSKETCKILLKRMFVLLEEGGMSYRILNDELEIPINICFYLGSGNCMFINLVKNDAFIQIQVVESGICQVFRQYLEYLEEKKLISSPEKSKELLREFAKQYEV